MKWYRVIGLFLLSGLIEFSSCSIPKKDESVLIQVQGEDTLYVCKVNEVNLHRKEKLSDWVSNFEIIYFENSDTALFRSWKEYVTEHYIGILQSANAPFKLFDRQGKYLCDIGRVGQGPGEYRSLYSAAIHEETGTICLAPFSGRGLLIYDLQGNLKRGFPLGDLQKAQIRYEANGDLTLVHLAFTDRSPFQFVRIDSQDSIYFMAPEEGQAIYPYDKKGNFTGYNHEIWFYNNTDDFTYMNTASDTLYTWDISNEKVKPRFATIPSSIDFDSYGIYDEYSSCFLVCLYKQGEKFTLIVDKEKKESAYLEVVNDFVGNLPVDLFSNVTDGWYHEMFEPFQLLELIEKRLAEKDCKEADRKVLMDLAERIDENGNNILFVAKLKR